MPLTTATISSRLLDGSGVNGLNLEVIISPVDRFGARVVLTSAAEGVTVAGKLLRRSFADGSGTLVARLLQLPQAGVTPVDARWQAVFRDRVTKREVLPRIQFALTGAKGWDDLIDVTGRAVTETTEPEETTPQVIDFAYDTDGAPYLTAEAGSNGSDIALDTDGVPYLTGIAGTADSEIAYDTDGVPYLIGA